MAKRKLFTSFVLAVTQLQLIVLVITGSAAVPVKRDVEEMGNDQNVSVDTCIINYYVNFVYKFRNDSLNLFVAFI